MPHVYPEPTLTEAKVNDSTGGVFSPLQARKTVAMSTTTSIGSQKTLEEFKINCPMRITDPRTLFQAGKREANDRITWRLRGFQLNCRTQQGRRVLAKQGLNQEIYRHPACRLIFWMPTVRLVSRFSRLERILPHWNHVLKTAVIAHTVLVLKECDVQASNASNSCQQE